MALVRCVNGGGRISPSLIAGTLVLRPNTPLLCLRAIPLGAGSTEVLSRVVRRPLYSIESSPSTARCRRPDTLALGRWLRLVGEDCALIALGGRLFKPCVLARELGLMSVPATLSRLAGRLAADDGRSYTDVREGGRSAAVFRDAGRGMPNDKRLMWLCDSLRPTMSSVSGVSTDDPVTEDSRFEVLLTVTDEGIAPGDARGVVSRGAGNFDLADWTRSSIFCMRSRRLLT